MKAKDVDKYIEQINMTLPIWLKSMENSVSFVYKMCATAFDDYTLDSVSLAYDLRQMLGMNFSAVEKEKAKKKLDSYQNGLDGLYYERDFKKRLGTLGIKRVKEMHANYLTFQVIGAYKAIEQFPARQITFYDRFIDEEYLFNYLTDKCPWIQSPWGAGGMIDNLGTILDCNIRMGYHKYQKIIDNIFNWLDANQSEQTGLWGREDIQGINGIINGGYHLMRGTYFLQGKEICYPERIIDSIIGDFRSNPIFGQKQANGCQDMDHFYLLCKCHNLVPSYKKSEIIRISECRLNRLFTLVYCQDGGFSFEARRAIDKHNYYTLSPGKNESDMVGSVFYLQTILSICDILNVGVILNASKTHG